MRNYLSYHFALQLRLLQRPTQYDTCYLRGRRAVYLSLPAVLDLIMADTRFQALKSLESPLPPSPPDSPPSPSVDITGQNQHF